jgi:hypothetical protein
MPPHDTPSTPPESMPAARPARRRRRPTTPPERWAWDNDYEHRLRTALARRLGTHWNISYELNPPPNDSPWPVWTRIDEDSGPAGWIHPAKLIITVYEPTNPGEPRQERPLQGEITWNQDEQPLRSIRETRPGASDDDTHLMWYALSAAIREMNRGGRPPGKAPSSQITAKLVRDRRREVQSEHEGIRPPRRSDLINNLASFTGLSPRTVRRRIGDLLELGELKPTDLPF